MANRASAARFMGVTKTGNLADLKATAGAAANSTTIFRYGAAGLTNSIRNIPLAVSTAAASVPAAPAAATGFGWKETAPLLTGEGYTIDPGTWSVSATMRRSGQTLENDFNVVLTAIIFRVPVSGSPVEITRAVCPRTLITTTNKTITGSGTTATATVMGVNETLQIEWYCTTVDGNGALTPPISATDFIMQVNASATDSRISAIPNYAIAYGRGVTDNAPAADTLARSVRVTRSVSDAAPATDTVARRANFPRTAADSAPATDAVTRVARFTRSASDSAPASDTITRTVRVSRTVTDSAPAADTVTRAIRYVRQASDNIGATGGGTTTTIIKRPIFIFDD